MATSEKFHVFINRKKVELEDDEMSGSEFLAATGFAGEEWDLLHLQGEGDPSGGQLVEQGTLLKLKNGMHFRAIPGNRTFG